MHVNVGLTEINECRCDSAVYEFNIAEWIVRIARLLVRVRLRSTFINVELDASTVLPSHDIEVPITILCGR